MNRILIIVPSYIPSDSRVIEQIKILKNEGFYLYAVGLGKKEEEGTLYGINYKILKKKSNVLKNWWIFIRELYGNFEIAIVEDLYLLPLACFFKKRGMIVIVDAHELASGSYDVYKNILKKFFWNTIEKLFLNCADGMITVSEGIKNYYSKIFKKRNIEVIYNLSPMFVDLERKDSEKLKIGYVGGIVNGRNLEIFLDAAEILKGKSNMEFYIIGGGDYLDTLKNHKYASRVIFTGYLSSEELYKKTSELSVGVVLLEGNSPNHIYSMPNKLFWYLSLGIPVIVPPYKEMANFVRSRGYGIVMESNDSESLVNAILKMSNSVFYNSVRESVLKDRRYFYWDYQRDKFLSYLRNIWEE